jgi:nucleotide-binding universal stress UspA family protein
MFHEILVAVGGRHSGRDALALAEQLAGRGAEITLTQERRAGHRLQEAAARLGADLLVVDQRALYRFPVYRRALNQAPCAVGIAPDGYALRVRPLKQIGVGADGSPESEQSLEVARGLAAHSGGSVKALSVVPLQEIPYGAPIHDNWSELTKRLMLERLNGIEGGVAYGDPAARLECLCASVDLLIVGSRSYGPLGRLVYGSTSNYLARRASCPLLVLPRSARGQESSDDRPLATVA